MLFRIEVPDFGLCLGTYANVHEVGLGVVKSGDKNISVYSLCIGSRGNWDHNGNDDVHIVLQVRGIDYNVIELNLVREDVLVVGVSRRVPLLAIVRPVIKALDRVSLALGC